LSVDDHPLLQEGIASMFSTMPGWISSNLHKSRDGKQVVVYSQWRDAKDIDAFRQDPRTKFAHTDGIDSFALLFEAPLAWPLQICCGAKAMRWPCRGRAC
jgi:hypothetical protein